MNKNTFFDTVTAIFEKIAVARTRQALAFLSDKELEDIGITRTSLDTGDFFNYKEVTQLPTQKVVKVKTVKAKAA